MFQSLINSRNLCIAVNRSSHPSMSGFTHHLPAVLVADLAPDARADHHTSEDDLDNTHNHIVIPCNDISDSILSDCVRSFADN